MGRLRARPQPARGTGNSARSRWRHQREPAGGGGARLATATDTNRGNGKLPEGRRWKLSRKASNTKTVAEPVASRAGPVAASVHHSARAGGGTKRIGRGLHDEIAQTLVGIKSAGRRAARPQATHGSPEEDQRTQRLVENRWTCASVRPNCGDRVGRPGLIPALHAFAKFTRNGVRAR